MPSGTCSEASAGALCIVHVSDGTGLLGFGFAGIGPCVAAAASEAESSASAKICCTLMVLEVFRTLAKALDVCR